MTDTTEGTLAESPRVLRPAAPAEGLLGTVDQLLRDRLGLLERIDGERDLAGLARAAILTIAVGAGAFGAALGFSRGGLQVLFAGVKLPLVILLTAAISTPALVAVRRVTVGRGSMPSALALVLSSLARGSLVLAALAPLVVLAASWGASYHQMVLIAVACCAVGGAVGLRLFLSRLGGERPGARAVIGAAILLVVALVGTQMTWTLRPYVVRPRTEDLPFVRALEGSFVDAVVTSADSARGVYHRPEAPLPGGARVEHDEPWGELDGEAAP